MRLMQMIGLFVILASGSPIRRYLRLSARLAPSLRGR